MNKLWAKNYFVLSSLVILLLAAVCSLTLVSGNISLAESKYIFESIYTDTSIDFIVPSPGYDQSSETENDPATGIEAMTPYYETSTSVTVNTKATGKGNVLIFPDVAKAEYTPYAAARITKGDKTITAGNAVIDTIYADANSCGLGDEMQISVAGESYTFKITGVTVSNTYYKEGSAALFLDATQAEMLKNAGIKYSACYVKSSDYETCKNYLFSEYKPLGRLKDKSEFDSEDTYNQHVKNFNEADWSKEITNCKANYDDLQVKYANVNSSIWINVSIYSVIAFLVVVVLNSLLLRNASVRQFMRTFLVKKGGTKAEITAFYSKGIIFDLILFVIACATGYFFIVKNTSVSLVGGSVVNALLPITAVLVASLIMACYAKFYVMKNYTISKK